MLNELLEREFEKLHGVKWADTAFSVRACWTDAWLTATAVEREACAKVCEAEGEGHRDGFGEHYAIKIRERSNAEVNPAA